MMRVITAVNDYIPRYDDVTCFLAGGITKCPEWQNDVINKLKGRYDLDHLVLFNPRRPDFPIGDPDAAQMQIEWEFNYLSTMDIFSMFFCGADSDQPICMYELGRHLVSMQYRFPFDWKDRIIITCDNFYKRAQDVYIQTGLALWNPQTECLFMSNDYDVLIANHVSGIIHAYYNLINKR